ncbi:MAG: hypothetical protein ACKVRP_01595 [Bacteroidota bacterium]
MKRILILFAAMMMLTMVDVMAQPFGPPPDGRHGERIDQLKKVRLVEMLDLNEEQSVRFFARLNESENKRRDLQKQKMDLLDRSERLMRNEADEKEFEKIFPEIMAVDQKMLQEKEKFFTGLTDLLSVSQRAKFLLFERQFERELRDAMKQVRRRRQPGGDDEK